MKEMNWKKQTNILWLGQFILLTCVSMSMPFWPLFIKQLNATDNQLAFWNAAIYTAPLIATIISAPLWGKLGDKVGHKRMVLRAAAGLLITQTLIAFFSNPLAIVIFRLIQGVFAGFIAAAQAYAMSITPEFSRGNILGKLQSASAVGSLLGPFLGGVIANYLNYQFIFSISSFFCVCAFLLLALGLDETPKEDNVKEKKSHSTEKDSLTKITLYFLLIIASVQAARLFLVPFFALFVTDKLGGNNLEVGLLYSATGLTVFIFAPIWGSLIDKRLKEEKSVKNILMMILFLSGCIQLFTAFAENVYVVLMLRLAWGICLGGLLPVLFTLLVYVSDKSHKGMVVGLGQSANKLGEVIGITSGAFIEDALGFTVSISLVAIAYFILSVILFSSRKIFTEKAFYG